jgi:hypothetical protein
VRSNSSSFTVCECTPPGTEPRTLLRLRSATACTSIAAAGSDRRRDCGTRIDYINHGLEKTWADICLPCNRRADFGRRTTVSAHRSHHDTALIPVPKPARPLRDTVCPTRFPRGDFNASRDCDGFDGRFSCVAAMLRIHSRGPLCHTIPRVTGSSARSAPFPSFGLSCREALRP